MLLGPSGCGKTTLLKLINRLIDADAGNIKINGEDIQSREAHFLRRDIGYVIQDVGLIPHLSIKQNIGLVNKIAGQEITNAKISELIELTGLSKDMLNRFPLDLSGGQQQRVGIARALANDASILLMDEPFSALDTLTRNQLQDDFLHLPGLDNKTIIMVTHDIQEAFKLADRIILLNEGEIQQDGAPEELLLHPANDFVQSFLEKDELILLLQSVSDGDQSLEQILRNPSISSEEKTKAFVKVFDQKKE